MARCWLTRPRGYLLLLLLGVVAPLVAVAAGQAAPPGTGQPVVITAGDEPVQATPSGEQVLRLAGPVRGWRSLDPALARDVDTGFVVHQIFRGLTRFDADLRPVPELAERIEISAGGLSYRFTLRDDARFHDGRPITAVDVVFSLTRALDPATAGGQAALLVGPTYLSDIAGADALMRGDADELAGARVIDERTVELTLSAPRATFLMKLANAAAAIVDPTDVARGGDWWQSPNGSGPFQVAEWVPGETLTLSRFDDYAAGPPPLAAVEIRIGPTASQTFNLYQAGQIDIDEVPLDVVDRVLDPASALRDQVTVTPLFAVHYVAFRLDEPPLDDPHVRRAIQLAFPRGKIAGVMFEGHVSEARGLIPDGMLGQAWPATPPPFDIEAARRELAASRYGSAAAVPPVRIYSGAGGSFSPATALRDTVQNHLGLEVEVIGVGWLEYVDGLALERYPAYEVYWRADYPDPESLLWTLFGTDSANNYVGYTNPSFDDLLQEAAATPDQVRRAELYARAQQQLIDDGVVIPFYHDVAYTVSDPAVRGLEVTPLGILRLETIWMER